MKETDVIKEFERIASLIEDVIRKRVDPFTVDVAELLRKLRLLLEEHGEEVMMYDIEALTRIVDLIKEQEEWVENESLVLGLGPFAALAKIRQLTVKEIAAKFTSAWKPITYRDQLTFSTIRRALKYVENLQKLPKTLLGSGGGLLVELSAEDLQNMGFLSEEEFRSRLSEFSKKLFKMLDERGEVEYWDAIIEDDFSKTVENAVLLSFLCSQGAVSLKMNPLTEEVKIVRSRGSRGEKYSVAIPLKYSEWVRRIAEKKRN